MAAPPGWTSRRIPEPDGHRRVRAAFGPVADRVRYWDEPRSGALAETFGDDVALSPEVQGADTLSELVVAHELAHVRAGATLDGAADERHADQVAAAAVRGAPLPTARAGQGLALRACQRDPVPVLLSGTPTHDEVTAYLDRFERMSRADQERDIGRMYSAGVFGGTLRNAFQALTPAERTGRYRDTMRRVLEIVERIEVRASAGMDEAAMARTQAAHMDTQASSGTSQAEITRRSGLATRPRNRWTEATTDQARYRAAVRPVEEAVVRRARAVAPELGVSRAHMHFDPDAIEGAGDTRVAEYDDAHNRLNYGMTFLERVDPRLLDPTASATMTPDNVVHLVIHEVFGHGEYGEIRDSMALDVYTAARPRTTRAYSAAERAAGPTSAERFAWGYQGTEIYSELREAQYRAGAPNPVGDEPATDIRNRVGIIKLQWEPRLARAFLRGMYARFRLDPRITAASLRLYEEAVEHHFPGENVLGTTP